MTYDDWIIAFDRLIDDIGQDISLNCSDEEITVAFYWFIFDLPKRYFSELYSNLLNPTQKREKIIRRVSDLLLNESRRLILNTSTAVVKTHIRNSANLRVEESSYIIDKDRAVPLTDMALLIDNAHIYVRNHVKGTLEKTEYIFQSSSIVRLAIHPSTTTWKHEEDLKILADYTNTSVLTVADTTVVKVGMRVSGNGIPEGTKVDEIIDGTKFNMSNVSFGGQHQAAEITLSDSFHIAKHRGFLCLD